VPVQMFVVAVAVVGEAVHPVGVVPVVAVDNTFLPVPMVVQVATFLQELGAYPDEVVAFVEVVHIEDVAGVVDHHILYLQPQQLLLDSHMPDDDIAHEEEEDAEPCPVQE